MCNADVPLLLQMRDRDVVTQLRVSISLDRRSAGSQSGREKGSDSYHSGPGSSTYRRFLSAGWSPVRWSRSCTRLLSERHWLGGGARGLSTGLCIQCGDCKVKGVSSPQVSSLLLFFKSLHHAPWIGMALNLYGWSQTFEEFMLIMVIKGRTHTYLQADYVMQGSGWGHMAMSFLKLLKS